MVSHPKVEDTPPCHTTKLGTPLCHSNGVTGWRWGHPTESKPRAPSSLALNTSRDGRGIHSLSGQLFLHLTALIAKNFPLTSNLNLPCLNFKPFSLVLLLSAVSKS